MIHKVKKNPRQPNAIRNKSDENQKRETKSFVGVRFVRGLEEEQSCNKQHLRREKKNNAIIRRTERKDIGERRPLSDSRISGDGQSQIKEKEKRKSMEGILKVTSLRGREVSRREKGKFAPYLAR